MIRRRMQSTKAGRRALIQAKVIFEKTFWDPETDDGRVFAKLARGDLAGLQWQFRNEGDPLYTAGHQLQGCRGRIYGAHVAYWPYSLAAAAFYCLVTDDHARGKQVANAIHSYYKLREAVVDAQNARVKDPAASDSWPHDLWRGMHEVVGKAALWACYDMAAAWMTDEQKALMRRLITKATRGRRAYGMNGPARWAETNWVGWDLQFTLTALAIEGEEGYDPEIIEAARRTVQGYLTWGINEHGTIFETNGKNGMGLHQAIACMAALARRGTNFFGHPHLRKLTAMQVHAVVPAGGRNVNNGTWGCAPFGNAAEIKGFFPGDRCADFLKRQADPDLHDFDPDAYEKALRNPRRGGPHWWRIHPPMPDSIYSFIDWQAPTAADGTLKEAWERDHLGLPLDFNDPVHGLLQTRSGNDKDALFLMFEARPDLRTVGHQQICQGHFYLSADGVDWAVEADPKAWQSTEHNVVLIDGQGHNEMVSPLVRYFPGQANEHGSLVSSDLSYTYTWGWTNPMHFRWPEATEEYDLQVDTRPEIVAFYKGTQHVKERIWMHSYWNYNWGPMMRAEFNPVRYAFRSAGLVRGKNPYALVVDDINKDGREHLYQWLMHVKDNVRIADGGRRDSFPGDIFLVETSEENLPGDDPRMHRRDRLERGTPVLLMRLVPAKGEEGQSAARIEQLTEPLLHKRLVIHRRAVDPEFKTILIPMRWGEEIPRSAWDRSARTLSLEWKDQTDHLRFAPAADQPTRIEVRRDGQAVLSNR